MSVPRVSFEFFPPKSTATEAPFLDAVARLVRLQPSFISLTFGAGGSASARGDRWVRHLFAEAGAPLAAHITCVGGTREEIDRLLTGWHQAGVRHIVALRGDPPANEEAPQGRYLNALELVQALAQRGDMEISVAAYPESHPKAESPEADLHVLKCKLDAGATRAITQYVFDPELFLRFRDRAWHAGIRKPLVPGILPVGDIDSLVSFSRRCGASVPDWLLRRFEPARGNPALTSQLAAITASEFCESLRREGVEDFHFYTLNRSTTVEAVCHRLGLGGSLEEAA